MLMPGARLYPLACLLAVPLLLASCGSGEKEARAKADSLAAILAAKDDSIRAATANRTADSVAEARRVQDSIQAERNRPRKVSLLATTSVPVRHQDFLDYGFTVPRDAQACMLGGRVEALSGGNKDVQVMVMSNDDFTNWRNSPQAKGQALFSEGPQTVVNLSAALTSGGSYHLVISNRFSFITDKTISGDVEVTCLGVPISVAH